MNVPAFEKRNGSLGLTDHKNLNREFPGNPEGTEMERLAWAVTRELQSAADYYIDLHSGDDYEQLTPYCLLYTSYGIQLVRQEESYTSQCSPFAPEVSKLYACLLYTSKAGTSIKRH